MSAIGLKSAFYSVGNNPEASAAVYNEFLEERKRVAAQLAKQRYGAGYNKGDIPLRDAKGQLTGFTMDTAYLTGCIDRCFQPDLCF